MTTTVIPSEPGEAGIPWWVWLLAALGGILLLALITYCLYKVRLSNKIFQPAIANVLFSAGSSKDGDQKTALRPSH